MIDFVFFQVYYMCLTCFCYCCTVRIWLIGNIIHIVRQHTSMEFVMPVFQVGGGRGGGTSFTSTLVLPYRHSPIRWLWVDQCLPFRCCNNICLTRAVILLAFLHYQKLSLVIPVVNASCRAIIFVIFIVPVFRKIVVFTLNILQVCGVLSFNFVSCQSNAMECLSISQAVMLFGGRSR